MVMLSSLNESDVTCMLTSSYSVVTVTFATVVCVVTVFGNILILMSLYKFPNQFKGSLYLFIGNLAAADLLLGFWMLLFISEEIFPELEQIWYFCVTKPFGIIVSYGCSVLSLLGLSVDRFMAIMFPMKHLVKTHKRKIFKLILFVIWLVSITGACLPLVLLEKRSAESSFICRIGVTIASEFQIVVSVILLVTSFLNCTLYGIVCWRIKHNKTPGNNKNNKKNRKTGLMICILVIFVVCWFPYIICSFLLEENLSLPMMKNVLCAREYLATLGFISSSLNWIVYGLANKKFQTAFKKILWFQCCDNLLKCSPFETSREAMRGMNASSHHGQTSESIQKNASRLSSVLNVQSRDVVNQTEPECNAKDKFQRKEDYISKFTEASGIVSSQDCYDNPLCAQNDGTEQVAGLKVREEETNRCNRSVETNINETFELTECTRM